MTDEVTIHKGISVRTTSAEARQLSEMSRAMGEAEARRKPLPAQRGILPETAFPVGVEPHEYARRMVSRGGGIPNQPDTTTDRTAAANYLPTVNLATADPRSSGGLATRSMSTLKAGDTVAVVLPSGATTRVEVDQAARMGLLIPDHMTGGYRIPNGDEQQAQQQAEQQEAQRQEQEEAADMPAMIEAGDAPDAATAKTFGDLIGVAGFEDVNHLVQDYTSNGGTLSLANVQEVERRIGLSSGSGEVIAQGLADGFYRQAAKAAVSSGVPTERVNELWQWAAENAPMAHRTAASALVLGRDASGIRHLAQMWLTDQRRIADNKA